MQYGVSWTLFSGDGHDRPVVDHIGLALGYLHKAGISQNLYLDNAYHADFWLILSTIPFNAVVARLQISRTSAFQCFVQGTYGVVCITFGLYPVFPLCIIYAQIENVAIGYLAWLLKQNSSPVIRKEKNGSAWISLL